jgi:hypothetical protein
MPVLRKIVSGGQTGADRAGLDFAIEVGLAHGGYVPKGRKAEDGRIDEKYALVRHDHRRRLRGDGLVVSPVKTRPGC